MPEDAAGCSALSQRLGDSFCDVDYDTAACGWDGGDCCQSTCTAGPSMNVCGYLGWLWCFDPNATDYSVCPGNKSSHFGNGLCDEYQQEYDAMGLNTADCGYDGGDCCPSTCTMPNSSQPCPSIVYACKDPTAVEFGNFSACTVSAPSFLGDGYCDDKLDSEVYNTEACAWDGGDCCEATCTGCGDEVDFPEVCRDPSQQTTSTTATPVAITTTTTTATRKHTASTRQAVMTTSTVKAQTTTRPPSHIRITTTTKRTVRPPATTSLFNADLTGDSGGAVANGGNVAAVLIVIVVMVAIVAAAILVHAKRRQMKRISTATALSSAAAAASAARDSSDNNDKAEAEAEEKEEEGAVGASPSRSNRFRHHHHSAATSTAEPRQSLSSLSEGLL